MSYVIDAANQFQIQSILAYKNLNNAAIRLARRPKMFVETSALEIPQNLRDSLAPVYDVFGSPAEVASYWADSIRAWNQASNDVANEVAEFVSPSAA